MRYKTTLDYTHRDKLLQDMREYLTEGIWLVDLDPRAESVLQGPFDSVADAHDNRDFIWHYGDKFGRYIWYVNTVNAASLLKLLMKNANNSDFSPMVELDIDTLPLEIVGLKIMSEGKSYRIPKVRRKN